MLIDDIYVLGVGIFFLIVFINLKYDKQIAYKKKKILIFYILTFIIAVLSGSFFADGYFIDVLLVSDGIQLFSLVYLIVCIYLYTIFNRLLEK